MNPAEDSFLSHLVELRNRLIRALLAIGLVFICLFPWAQGALCAARATLAGDAAARGADDCDRRDRGFLVPMKVALMVAFLIALPYVLYQVWAFVAPGLYAHEKRLALPLVAASVSVVLRRYGLCLFSRLPGGLRLHGDRGARGCRLDDRHRKISVFRVDHLHCLWRDLRGAGDRARSGPGRRRRARQAARNGVRM
jgi:hypothetical protein